MADQRDRSIVVITVGSRDLDPPTQETNQMDTRKAGRKMIVAGALTAIALGFSAKGAEASPNDACANARHWSDHTALRMQDAMTYQEWDYWYNAWEINEEYMDDLGC
jgi:hypothetical protein